MGSSVNNGKADDRLILAFAEAAAARGWSARTLRAFSVEQGLSAEEQQRRWPDGVRTLGHALNAYADARTREACDLETRAPLSEILLRRFEENEPFKRAVRSLAWSDLCHPVDTLRRTAATVVLFWRCQDQPLPSSRWLFALKTAALVVLYSATVLVWLHDEPPAYDRLRRMIGWSVRLAGAR